METSKIHWIDNITSLEPESVGQCQKHRIFFKKFCVNEVRIRVKVKS